MSRSKPSIDEAQKILYQMWNEVLQLSPAELERTDFVEDSTLYQLIRDLMTARTKAFRYAALTQIIAKAVSPDINCLTLQANAGLIGAFDARSFCKKVLVPFERKYLGGALGNSQDPYVSKPLRRPKITLDPDIRREIKYQDEWEKLYNLLDRVEDENNSELTRRVLRQMLLEIRKLISLQLPSLPAKLSAEKTRSILETYIKQPTLGLGPQAIAYSLLVAFNKRTGTYREVNSASPTTADAPSGRKADVECMNTEGDLQLAVYVTQKLDQYKLDDELKKCKEKNISNVLFLSIESELSVEEAYKRASEYGINATFSSLLDFALSISALLNGEMRRELIEDIVRVLHEWGGSEAEREFIEAVKRVMAGK